MATSTTDAAAQTTLGRVGVHDYQLGDLLVDKGTGRATKLILRECPLCASDPSRPRHHFGDGDSRPDHFRAYHSAKEV